MHPNIINNESLAKHTSWRIGGPARYYAEVADPDNLQATLHWANEHETPVFLLGGGTNLLVDDSGFNGLVVRYRAASWNISALDDDDETGLVMVGAGAPMAHIARRTCAQGWGGLEWAEGLPGTVGGAAYGNAGCYGGDVAAQMMRASVLIDAGSDSNQRFVIDEWPVELFAFGYRTSALKTPQPSNLADSSGIRLPPIVLAAEFRLHRAPPEELAATMKRIAAERRRKTPWGRTCGSVFKNPPGESAGRLIEQTGLKGRRIGAAEISEQHANYIINLGGASSSDVLGLIDLARNAVMQQFGIELALEIQIIGAMTAIVSKT